MLSGRRSATRQSVIKSLMAFFLGSEQAVAEGLAMACWVIRGCAFCRVADFSTDPWSSDFTLKERGCLRSRCAWRFEVPPWYANVFLQSLQTVSDFPSVEGCGWSKKDQTGERKLLAMKDRKTCGARQTQQNFPKSESRRTHLRWVDLSRSKGLTKMSTDNAYE